MCWSITASRCRARPLASASELRALRTVLPSTATTHRSGEPGRSPTPMLRAPAGGWRRHWYSTPSLATLIWRICSTAPSAFLGAAPARPDSTARVAFSASSRSFFPRNRRSRRSGPATAGRAAGRLPSDSGVSRPSRQRLIGGTDLGEEPVLQPDIDHVVDAPAHQGNSHRLRRTPARFRRPGLGCRHGHDPRHHGQPTPDGAPWVRRKGVPHDTSSLARRAAT